MAAWSFSFGGGSGSGGSGSGDPAAAGSGNSGGFWDGFNIGDVIGIGKDAAQIFTNYDLAKRAENAQRPTTYQVGPGGFPVVTGGGAPNLGLAGANNPFGTGASFGGSTIWIFLIAFIVLILLLKR
jgi:hypothetical protein